MDQGEKLKVLVTGGAGFIGSNFILELLKSAPSHLVTVYDSLTYAADPSLIALLTDKHKNFNFIHSDIGNYAELEQAVSKATHIVHFAAETHVTRSIADNDIFFQTDVIGTKNLVQAITKHKNNIEKFIHISTSEVYGDAVNALMDENHVMNPKSPYAAAKLGADRLVYAFKETYGIPATIVRPFNQYGPRQHIEKVIPRFITSALLGEPLIIHGDGKSKRDYLYVTDLIDFLIRILNSDENLTGNIFNIGSGKGVSVLEIAQTISLLMDLPTKIEFHDDRPGQVARHTADISRASQIFAWKPLTSFEDGLMSTINWYRSNERFWTRQLWLKKVKITLPNGKVVEQ